MTMVFQKVNGLDAAVQYLKMDGERFEPCEADDAEMLKITYLESGETLWADVTEDEPDDPDDFPDVDGQADPDLEEEEK